MSVALTLRDWLKDRIESLSSVQKVYGYEPETFGGWPAVTITMPSVDGEFSSNTENSRLFSFRIQVFFPLGQDIETPSTMPREQYAENVVAECVEQITDLLDDNFIMPGAGLPSDYTVKFANATDLFPFYSESDTGWLRGAEITISIYAEKTVV